jgi:hypothetical protein
MTGARKGWPEKGIVYPRSDLALRHGAGVDGSRRSRLRDHGGDGLELQVVPALAG